MSTDNEQANQLRRLIDLLEKRVGTPSTGYYGSVQIDAELISLVGAARSEFEDLLQSKERLEWLHNGAGITDPDGYEWGVARVKFNQSGQFTDILWTKSDHSDLDAEMARSAKAS